MVESRWDVRGAEIRYRNHIWELTGEVDVLDRGELLAVRARQVDDERHPTATLHFGLAEPGDSLNPGTLGEHFDHVERSDGKQYLVVKKERRTYRYEPTHLTYE